MPDVDGRNCGAFMSLQAIEREARDRLQYEWQLSSNKGKRWKVGFADRNYCEIYESGPVKAQSENDYLLRLSNVRQ